MDTILTLIENNAAGIITTLIAAIVAYIKSGNLKDAIAELDFLNPDNEEVTTAPGTKYNTDISWKMGDEQKTEIFEGLSDIEIKALTSEIELNEMKGLETYELTTTKGTYTIENGYIEKRPTSEASQWRVTHDVNGDLIGLFDVLGLFSDSKGKKPLTQISRGGANYAYLRYKMTSVGVINPGIQVGDEDLLWLGTDSDTSEELATVRTQKFKLCDYPAQTLEGDTVEIKVFKGYETKGTGTKETEIKKIEGSTTVYNITVVD